MLEQADAFWTLHLGFWQGDEKAEGGNVIGYMERAFAAADRGRWGEAGAECIAAQPVAEAAAFTALMAPTTEIEQLETAFWEEIQDALYWCATGTDTATDLINSSVDVAMALSDRIEDALGELGYAISDE
jgi:hypothetical protein